MRCNVTIFTFFRINIVFCANSVTSGSGFVLKSGLTVNYPSRITILYLEILLVLEALLLAIGHLHGRAIIRDFFLVLLRRCRCLSHTHTVSHSKHIHTYY